jgi:hypothetical protein
MVCILNDKIYLRMVILVTVWSLCETIKKCAHVGLREETEFDFTSAFLV